MQVVGDRFEQRLEERDGDQASGLVVLLDEGELRRPADPDVEVELAFLSADLGDVDVEVADRKALNFCLAGLFPVMSGSWLMPWRYR